MNEETQEPVEQTQQPTNPATKTPEIVVALAYAFAGIFVVVNHTGVKAIAELVLLLLGIFSMFKLVIILTNADGDSPATRPLMLYMIAAASSLALPMASSMMVGTPFGEPSENNDTFDVHEDAASDEALRMDSSISASGDVAP
ncbi:hypothetical protein [Vibrio crassostreae]|uniref:hypothetical protein n=1 Tax=Vibrio crassostreae TaxID=246167 RepID=UPI001B3116DF|nr:hypothetical protein [Vibrio crassostreae]